MTFSSQSHLARKYQREPIGLGRVFSGMNPAILEIDGSFGEGGGQILRSSLALSLITQIPIRISNIRAGRKKPGLQQQHLTSVKAAAEIGRAELSGAELHSQEITFRPGEVAAGEYHFSINTAGSTMLVLQTVLPPLLIAAGPSKLTVSGGTHNPNAPPFDFLARSFLPLINSMGPVVVASLHRPGFFPVGGGSATISIEPVRKLRPLFLTERGPIEVRRARAVLARLPKHIAERELRTIGKELGWDEKYLQIEEWNSAKGVGNVVLIEIGSRHVHELFASFGERGVKAETVASIAAREAREYLQADVAVGPHLADQLILPLALAGHGSFTTLRPTLHTLTNIEVVKKFLPVAVTVTELGNGAWSIDVASNQQRENRQHRIETG